MRKRKWIIAVSVFLSVLLFFGVGELSGFLKLSLAVRKYSSVRTQEEWEEFRAFRLEESCLVSCRRQSKMPWYPLLFSGNNEDGAPEIMKSVLADMECFPVKVKKNKGESVRFEDSWGGVRTFGGQRRHEGTDLMPSEDVRGRFPVVSVSDGVVEQKGWLKLGGWRIGIRSPRGVYFYYAHLDRYAEDLEEGDKVKAGQILGYMGDSGYGEEGTVGQFAVHLHFGIYVDREGEEISINPYQMLRVVE